MTEPTAQDREAIAARRAQLTADAAELHNRAQAERDAAAAAGLASDRAAQMDRDARAMERELADLDDVR